jgi:hypothetical protein
MATGNGVVRAGLPTVYRLAPDKEAEARLLIKRVDDLAVKLGRADFAVAQAESARAAARQELAGEMAQLQNCLSAAAKELAVPEPWNYDKGEFLPR